MSTKRRWSPSTGVCFRIVTTIALNHADVLLDMSTTTSNTANRTDQAEDAVRELNAIALGASGAIVAAAVMLLLGVFGAVGVYEGAVAMMEQWHLFFEPTVVGTVAGMVEAAVISFVLVYAFAWLYNALAR